MSYFSNFLRRYRVHIDLRSAPKTGHGEFLNMLQFPFGFRLIVEKQILIDRTGVLVEYDLFLSCTNQRIF